MLEVPTGAFTGVGMGNDASAGQPMTSSSRRAEVWLNNPDKADKAIVLNQSPALGDRLDGHAPSAHAAGASL